MSLLPKEHGAYGQIAFPLLTAFAASGLSWGGVFVATMVVAGFLAHEPGAVLLGMRGVRARRELGVTAKRWLSVWGTIGACSGAAAVVAMSAAARWSLAIPVAPALVLTWATLNGREKSSYGEAAAALAFSGASVPVSIAAGTSVEQAIAVAVPFALLFTASTLAIRVVILRVRGGGEPRVVTATRLALFSLCGGALAGLTFATVFDILPAGVLVASVPGLGVSAAIAAAPPPPTQLRRLGWGLVATSLMTASIVVVIL